MEASNKPAMTPEQQAQFEKLTRLQQKLVINLAAGMSKPDAYIAAGGRARGENIRSCVAEILAKPDVSLLLTSLTNSLAEKALISAEDIVRRLIQVAGLDREHSPEDATPATQMAALKMLGDYTGGFDQNRTKMEVGASATIYRPISLEEFLNASKRETGTES